MLRDILKGLRGDHRRNDGPSKTRSNQRVRIQARCVVEDLEGRQLLSQGLVGHNIQAAAVHIAKAHHAAPVHHQATVHGHHQNTAAGSNLGGTNVPSTPTGNLSAPPISAGVQTTPPSTQPPVSSLSWHYVGVAQLYTPAIQYAGYSTDQVATILKQSGLSDTQTQGLINGQQVSILDTTDNAQAQNFMSSYIIPSVVQVHYYIQTS